MDGQYLSSSPLRPLPGGGTSCPLQRRRPPPPSIRWPAFEMVMKSDSRTGCMTRTTPCGRVCDRTRGGLEGGPAAGGARMRPGGTGAWPAGPPRLQHHAVPWRRTVPSITDTKVQQQHSAAAALSSSRCSPLHQPPCAALAPPAGHPKTRACSQGPPTQVNHIETQPQQLSRASRGISQRCGRTAAQVNAQGHPPVEAAGAEGAGALPARKEAAVDARQLGLVPCSSRRQVASHLHTPLAQCEP